MAVLFACLFPFVRIERPWSTAEVMSGQSVIIATPYLRQPSQRQVIVVRLSLFIFVCLHELMLNVPVNRVSYAHVGTLPICDKTFTCTRNLICHIDGKHKMDFFFQCVDDRDIKCLSKSLLQYCQKDDRFSRIKLTGSSPTR